MFMTERAAGSDVGATVTRAIPDGDAWRLHGDKWFCSNADAGLALVLARPEGAPAGLKGVSLFLLPRDLPEGGRNAYRIVRLTRSDAHTSELQSTQRTSYAVF